MYLTIRASVSNARIRERTKTCYVYFLVAEQESTREIGIGEALTAEPFGTSSIIRLFYLDSEPPNKLWYDCHRCPERSEEMPSGCNHYYFDSLRGAPPYVPLPAPVKAFACSRN